MVKRDQHGDTIGTPRPTKQKDYAQQLLNRRFNRGTSEAADWREAAPDKLAAVVCSITRLGFAVQFGTTKDGGAYSIRIVGGAEPITEYVRPTEDLDLHLDGIIADMSAIDD